MNSPTITRLRKELATRAAATQKTREEDYRVYCEKLKKNPYGGQPHPITSFKWLPCCLCRKTIVDDPFGHNPFPLCEIEDNESRACSKCNLDFVLPWRMRCMEEDLTSPEAAREFIRTYEEGVRFCISKRGVQRDAGSVL